MKGSSYSVVKAAVVAALKARPALSQVAVSYQAPVQATDAQGPAGGHEAIWLDDAEGDQNNVIIKGLPLTLDESYTLRLVVQVLARSSEGTQQVADARVDDLLGEIVHAFASNPTFGVEPADAGAGATFDHLQITRAGFRRVTGFLQGSSGHGARAELDLQVEARISFI